MVNGFPSQISLGSSFLKDLLNKIGINVVELHLYDVCAFRDTAQWNQFRELFSQDKIDGIIALIMSVGEKMSNDREGEGESYYEEHGLRMI